MSNDERKTPGRDEVMLQMANVLERVMAKLEAPPPPTFQDQMDSQSERFREQIAKRPCPEQKIYKGCISPETGARFTAVCRADDTIAQILDYEYPEWSMKFVADGGRVPNEWREMMKTIPEYRGGGGHNAVEVKYLQWRWEESWK